MGNERIKILIILRMIGFGGAERQVVELCNAINKTLFDITVVLFFPSEGYLDDLKRTGVRVVILGKKKGYLLTVWARLWTLLKQEKFDIVYTFLPIPNFIGGLTARMAGVPRIICSLRNASPFSWSNVFCLMDFFAFHSFADIVIANTPNVGRWAVEKYRLPQQKVRVISNGRSLTVTKNQDDHSSICTELGLPQNARIVLTAGRVAQQKGHIYLVQAASIIVKRKENIFFLIAGKPEDAYDQVLSEIRRLRLESVVKLVGIREDIERLMAGCDMFVFPSLWEGMANALLEAMQISLPIVATDIIANRELIENGKNGILVPPKNAPLLAEAIISVLQEPSKVQKMADLGRLIICQKFSSQGMADRHSELFSSSGK